MGDNWPLNPANPLSPTNPLSPLWYPQDNSSSETISLEESQRRGEELQNVLFVVFSVFILVLFVINIITHFKNKKSDVKRSKVSTIRQDS
jgi:hypothetical protein